MKNKKYILLLGLLIPLLFTIGFSSWIIMYSFDFSPKYENTGISRLFDYENFTTYNGEGQLPSPKDGVTISGNIKYDYKLESSNTFITDGSKPVNAGTYDVKITIENSTINGTCQVKFIINKKGIKLSSNTININYGDCDRYWSSMGAKIKNSISFLDKDNNPISDFTFGNECLLKGMHNGLYYYGDTDYKVSGLTTTTNIAGSTYVGEIIFINNDVAENYEFLSNNKIIIKYKTAIVSGQYYTIEDAIKNQNGAITLIGDYSSNTSYVETVFCCLSESEGNPYTKIAGYYTEDSVNYSGQKVFKITSGHLLVPYENSTNYFLENDASSSTSRVYSCLHIPESVALVFNSSTQLRIGGVLNTSGNIGYRGVILNNGTITFESSSTLYAYGFLKGNGLVNMKSGSTAYDIMRMFDWPGGSAGSSMASSAFPIISWSCHNISCPTKIYKGATLMGYSSLSVTLIGYKKPSFCIIGASNTTGDCLFRPSASAKSTDYVLKAGSSSNGLINTSIVESNQNMGQKDIIEIHGDYEDNALKISVSIYPFQTSTSKPVPISYMDITIASGGMLTIGTSSYVFLLGTCVTVEENAVLNVSGSAFAVFDSMSGTTKDTSIINPWFGTNYCVNEVDAMLVLNGTLTGTGTVSGKIVTETSGAQSSISSYSISSLTMKLDASSAGSVLSETYYSYGDIGDASSFTYSKFINGTSYISTTLDGEGVENKEYYFTAATNVKTFILKFFDSDKTTELGTKNIQVLLPNVDGNYVYTLSGMELVPSKMHYDFYEWYYMSNDNIAGGTTLIFNLDDPTANTYNFYASWVEHEYTITYSAGYEDPDTGEIVSLELIDLVLTDVIYSFKLSDFINSPVQITTQATYNDYYFNGWYIGIDNSTGVQLFELSKSNIELFVNTFGNDASIPLYCQFTSKVLYTIIFNDNIEGLECSSLEVYSDEIITLPDTITNQYDKDSAYKFYLYGWYYVESPSTSSSGKYYGQVLSEILSKIDVSTNNVITLNALWVEKNRVEYYDEAGKILNDLTQYYKPGNSITLQSENVLSKSDGEITDSNGKYHVKYELVGWEGFDTTSGSYSVNELCKLTDTVSKLKPKFDIVSSYCIVTIELSNASVTIGTQSYKSSTSINIDKGKSYTISVSYSEDDDKEFTVDGSTFTSGNNYTFNYDVKISASSSSSCIVSGTLITLADGTKKPIEEVTYDDYILVFNHETGTYDISKMLFITHENEEHDLYEIIELIFDNNSNLRIVQEHVLFDLTLNKYVVIDKFNVNEYIGHDFYTTEFINGSFVNIKITLDSYKVYDDYVKLYCPVTATHMNCFANNILIMPSFPYDITGVFNIFELDDNMKYDEFLMNQDISKYGLFTYDEIIAFLDYEITYETFIYTPAKYLKVSLGKGLITKQEILMLLDYLLSGSLIE